jgi:hypothetical protein
MRRRTKTICTDATALLTDVNGGNEKRRQEAEPEDEKGQTVHVGAAAAPKRAHRPNPKYDAAQWPVGHERRLEKHKGATRTLTDVGAMLPCRETRKCYATTP